MNFAKLMISLVIAGIAIFAVSVIQNDIIIASGQTQSFSGAEPLVAPALVGAIVFVIILERLQAVHL